MPQRSRLFSIARLPQIEFGPASLNKLPQLAAAFGSRVLLVTGGHSLEQSPCWPALHEAMLSQEMTIERIKVTAEPSPELVDTTVNRFHPQRIELVVGIGGGSVLDAAKAIAGLLPHGNSVMQHLEGVGPELPYQGPPLPFIAVPTTAGTGSEATKNAVLSKTGPNGFKKSFRDAQLVADIAIVDPDLLQTCPPALIAANGMDAFTQLLESFTSLRSNQLTDTLALDGIRAVRDSLLDWYAGTGDQAAARYRMAYASMLSGITLAQTGLGSVHGLASPLGAFFPIPHGVVCGTLVAVATETNIKAMQERERNNPALEKYAQVGRLLADDPDLIQTEALKRLVKTLYSWTAKLELPLLENYGVSPTDWPAIIRHSRGSSMKTNPIVLTDTEIEKILQARTAA